MHLSASLTWKASPLQIGMEGPALQSGALSTIGIELGDWTEQAGINFENGAVFFMDPTNGATEQPVVFAQLTVRAGSRFQGSLSAQGKTRGGGEDWASNGLRFSERGGAPAPPPTQAGPPPPPPPAPSCASTTPVPRVANGEWTVTGDREAALTCAFGFSAQQGGQQLSNAGLHCTNGRWSMSSAECLPDRAPPPPPSAAEGVASVDSAGYGTMSFQGDTWYLVRRSTGQWHKANDEAHGTEAYGACKTVILSRFVALSFSLTPKASLLQTTPTLPRTRRCSRSDMPTSTGTRCSSPAEIWSSG